MLLGYLSLLNALRKGEEESINAYSFVIWGSLSLCTTLLTTQKDVDPSIKWFTLTMSFFQYLIAWTSFRRRQYKKITKPELASIAIATLAMLLWYFTQHMGAVALSMVILADFCALIPTIIEIRKAKSIKVAFIAGFVLFGIVASLVLAGLRERNFKSLVYPIFEAFVNYGIAIFALGRKLRFRLSVG